MRTPHLFALGALIGGVALAPAAMAGMVGDGKGGLTFQTLPQARVTTPGQAAELPAALAPRGPQKVTGAGGQMILGPVPTAPALSLTAGSAPSLPPALRLRGLPEVTSNGELTPEAMPVFRG